MHTFSLYILTILAYRQQTRANSYLTTCPINLGLNSLEKGHAKYEWNIFLKYIKRTVISKTTKLNT
jgi:hypothetical protein